jgi:hypothetical protein
MINTILQNSLRHPSYVNRWRSEHPGLLFLFNSFQFYLLFFLPRMIRERRISAVASRLQSSLQPPASLHQPAAACYSCKIIFHFQTWGIGFNLCPVLRLAKWKLAFVMQINAELQKADKRTHTHTQNHIHRDSLSSPGQQHQRQLAAALSRPTMFFSLCSRSLFSAYQ